MRRELALGLCLGASCLISACDPFAENRLFREGIGTDLSRPELADATRLQSAYLGYLCQQAGLSVAPDGDAFRCVELPPGSRGWAIVVQAGMNDIDQRCDAYLAWLDDRRRSRAPVLSQINALQTATTAIMRLAGREADPIAIVGVAFGLASDTFTNVNSRLLLEVNHSTVQAVVLNRRNEFRFNASNLRIDNRPAAIHVLRSYLNICMPFTIEMAINTTVTAFELGGTPALSRTSKIATTTLPLPTIRSDQPPPAPPPVAKVLGGALTGVERKSISIDDAKAFQRTLCVMQDTGDFGTEASPTRLALRQFLEARYYPDAPPNPATIATLEDLRHLRSAQSTFPSCSAVGFANAFEVGIFSQPDVDGTIDPMKKASNMAFAIEKAGISAPEALRGQTFGPPVVAALHGVIPALRSKYGLAGKSTLDRQLYDRMMRQIGR